MDNENFELNVLLKTVGRSSASIGLSKKNMEETPFDQFEIWIREAFKNGDEQANAMVLSTVGPDLTPDSRVVLLKDLSNGVFSFFTNYNSKKANDLRYNPNASLLFFWKELHRQVRVEGTVRFISEKESEEYFSTRPFESKIGAWVSKQSSVIENREVMEDSFNLLCEQYHNKAVPKPENWGGYVLIPSRFEFWQARGNRLHDRILYIRNEKAKRWELQRLMP